MVVETVVEGTLVTGATGLKAVVGFTAANSMKREQINLRREFIFDDFGVVVVMNLRIEWCDEYYDEVMMYDVMFLLSLLRCCSLF